MSDELEVVAVVHTASADASQYPPCIEAGPFTQDEIADYINTLKWMFDDMKWLVGLGSAVNLFVIEQPIRPGYCGMQTQKNLRQAHISLAEAVASLTVLDE